MADAMRKPQTDLERLLDRIRSATYALESAADEAADAAGELKGIAEGDVPAVPASQQDVRALAEMVVRMHDDEHEGPRRWCTREVCKRAEEVLA